MRNEYTQFSSWFILSRGFKRMAAYEAEGWALVSVVPINMFGGTFAYNFVLRRSAAG